MVVVPGDVGMVAGDVRDGALPQVAGEGQHVRLVHQGQAVAAPGGQLEGKAHAALHAHAGVDRALRGHLVRRPLAQEAAFAGVGALGVLAHDDEVGALGDGAGHAAEGAQVDVEVELEAQAQEEPPLEGPGRNAGVAHRRADRPQQNGLEAAQLVQRLVGQHDTVAQVAGGAQVEVGDVELDAGGGDDLQCLVAHLRPDAVAADDGDPMRGPGRAHCPCSSSPVV